MTYEHYEHESSPIEYKGLQIRIIQDSDPMSPEDYGDNGVFVVANCRDFCTLPEGFTVERDGDYGDPEEDMLSEAKADADAYLEEQKGIDAMMAS